MYQGETAFEVPSLNWGRGKSKHLNRSVLQKLRREGVSISITVQKFQEKVIEWLRKYKQS